MLVQFNSVLVGRQPGLQVILTK